MTAGGFDFAVAADTSMRFLFAIGNVAGARAETWVAQRTAGKFAAPKP
jgi:hypothetical protein